MSQKPSITIVTITYNAARFIGRFAQSVVQLLQQNEELSLVIVDNASSDDTVVKLNEVIEVHNLQHRARIIDAGGNLGFGRGCNRGAFEARAFAADYLWFLNPDTEVEQSAYTALLQGFAQHATDFAGSALKNELGEIRSGAFRFPTLLTVFLSNAKLGVFDRLLANHTNTVAVTAGASYVDWLTGASFMVKTTVFEALSGFDPHYFLYFEEVDLFLRAKRAGYKALFYPQSVVFHESGASTGMNTKNAGELKPRPKYWFESRRYFYWQRFGRGYFLAVDIAFLLGQMISRSKALLLGQPVNEPPGLLRCIVAHSALFGQHPVNNNTPGKIK